ncbi:histidine kinase [Pseudobacter ginsenosidimutans]|uniref:Histidine kinase n=2 Tax=Pseudobacter ginsenosidimutans TaxID=661488 RepID=A0A4Q7MLP2_9BACT|nr:sensor histidine kinase [Pseudobacter ginsenosidimutans]RZS69321.1 histidine kinase [Pseudobacter ginsenosidimutans]
MIAQLQIPVRKLNFGHLNDKKTTIRNIIHVVFILIPVTCWFILLIWWMKRTELFQQDAGSIAGLLALTVLMFLLVFGGIQLWRNYLHHHAYRRRELHQKAMENEIKMLKAQIEPHFLFNTLNRISATVPPQHEATRELIARLADTFRYALRSTKEEMVPLKDELSFIRNYLQLEQERFGNRLSVRIPDENIQDVMIAPMLLQPLVENAIVHGIGPSVKGGTISIVCRRMDTHMLISVSDDAVPFEGDPEKLLCGNGVGLKNTAIRIERIYQQNIRIEKNQPRGLTFSFFVPILENL